MKLSQAWKTGSSRYFSIILFGCAALLAASAIVAAPATKSTRKGDCLGWPADQDKDKVEKAFESALNGSAQNNPEGARLRAKLLKSHKSAKDTVQDILNGMPGRKVTIPPKAWIIFYEPENLPHTKARPFTEDYPSDHCYHVFYLPEVGAGANATFRESLMCCYKPWRPTKP
jgi:hypothetical protein